LASELKNILTPTLALPHQGGGVLMYVNKRKSPLPLWERVRVRGNEDEE